MKTNKIIFLTTAAILTSLLIFTAGCKTTNQTATDQPGADGEITDEQRAQYPHYTGEGWEEKVGVYGAFLFKDPSAGALALDYIVPTDKVIVFATNGEFYRVVTSSGREGFVSTNAAGLDLSDLPFDPYKTVSAADRRQSRTLTAEATNLYPRENLVIPLSEDPIFNPDDPALHTAYSNLVRAIELNPKNWEAFGYLQSILITAGYLGDFGAAMTLFDLSIYRVIATEGNDADAWVALGWSVSAPALINASGQPMPELAEIAFMKRACSAIVESDNFDADTAVTASDFAYLIADEYR